MSNDIKVLHLSDLHYTDGDTWKQKFSDILSFIKQYKIWAHVIIVTGDCLDNPDQDMVALGGYLNELTKTVSQYLSREGNGVVAQHHVPNVICVPGNHDYYSYGNVIPKPGIFRRIFGNRDKSVSVPERKTIWKDGVPLQTPQAVPEEVAAEVLKNYGIAFFPLDSNGVTSQGFARGCVTNPGNEFNRLEQKFLASRISGSRIKQAFRICLMHHHPVSLFAPPWTGNLEHFTLLENNHAFLREAAKASIDLILHGHRHASGHCRINLPATDGTEKADGFASTHPLVISACASSIESNKDGEREICLFAIQGESGSCRRISFRTSRTNPGSFSKRSEIPLVSYEERRQVFFRRAMQGDQAVSLHNGQEYGSTIRNAGFKVKTVTMDQTPSGSAGVQIGLGNIQISSGRILNISGSRSDLSGILVASPLCNTISQPTPTLITRFGTRINRSPRLRPTDRWWQMNRRCSP